MHSIFQVVKRFPDDDFTDDKQCETGDHGSSMSPSLIILVTISILLNIYFIVYFVMKRRGRSKNRIANNPENPLTPEASKNEGNTNPDLNVDSTPDEDLKNAKDHDVV